MTFHVRRGDEMTFHVRRGRGNDISCPERKITSRSMSGQGDEMTFHVRRGR
jgi:hypothetical protein